MKIKIAFILILYITHNSSFGQFEVKISASKINNCKDSLITFIAEAKNGAATINDATFKWSFGDGSSTISGYMLDSVTHKFQGRGGYIVRVDATSGTNSDYAFQKIQIGVKPDFTGTNVDKKGPLCQRQQILLTGKYKTANWLYNVPDTVIQSIPVMISNTNQYKASLDYRIFNKTDRITNSSNISLVGLKMEHSNSSNLKIELKCPDGKSVVLKNDGGADKYFGIPIDNESSNQAGTGYQYSWTNSPSLGKMSVVNPTGSAYLADSYTSEQPFSNLVGCPLNGVWEIIITDNQNLDNGFVFASQLQFDPNLLPAKWEYNNSYSNPVWSGSGVSSTSGSGLATAVPGLVGNIEYIFKVKDNYGCPQDTSRFIVSVTEPTFTTSIDPPAGDFPLEITFTNTTEWATKFQWNFGDGSDISTTENPTYTYKKDGTFIAKLIASTDDNCTDTASVQVIATIPVAVFEKMPNTFTPNGDGQNDKFFLNSSSLKGIATLDGWIYSRWGKKVAEWHSVEDAIDGWDGYIKGGPEASPGVYYYYIKAVGYDGQEKVQKGSFQLFR